MWCGRAGAAAGAGPGEPPGTRRSRPRRTGGGSIAKDRNAAVAGVLRAPGYFSAPAVSPCTTWRWKMM
ncbi:hypothetical protein ACE1SV_11910 [Streptomyces sennicomposti]